MRHALCICALALLALSGAHAGPLTGDQIRAQLTGARIVGENDLGAPYSVWLNRGGSLKGIQGKKNQFDDRGRWWVTGDKLCFHWELWLFNQPTCYTVELDGNRLTRTEPVSRTVIRSTLVRAGKS